MGTVERVTELVAPILADLGLELYDLEHGGGILKLTVDRPGGVDLEALALATRSVSRQLDHADPIPGKYTLEVTSPGLERWLRTPTHFAGAVGGRVTVRTHPGVEGDRRVSGVLVAADDEGIVVRPDAEGAAEPVERRLRYGDIERARTVFEWVRPEKPGKSKAKPDRAAAATRPGDDATRRAEGS